MDDYTDGVWLVELAALADPALLPEAVLSALGVDRAPTSRETREEASRPPAVVLTEYLRHKTLLLLLDNCEHLTETCARLAETLLRACPGLRILTTSRESLGLTGETAWRVPSLSVPPVGAPLAGAQYGNEGRPPGSPLHALLQYESIRLFVERATSVLPTFQVTEKNAPALAQVCWRLDGIPLAIELAAARVKALAVEQMAARLDDQFRLLTGGSRTALPRQQTLRATIDWSYDLLTEAERSLLRRLAVFAGGWTLEAAEQVCSDCELRIANCGLAPEELPRSSWSGSVPADPADRRHGLLPPIRNSQLAIRNEDVLDLLTRLVDKSLVQYDEQDGVGRYRLLEIIRQYSRDRLMETEEVAALRARHLDFFLALAERVEPELWGVEQVAGLDRLETEQDNLRRGPCRVLAPEATAAG